MREGYRVFQLRSRLGTRIESCFLLVHVSFTSQFNAWAGTNTLIEQQLDQEQTIQKLRQELTAANNMLAALK